jgi:hypothetical protein
MGKQERARKKKEGSCLRVSDNCWKAMAGFQVAVATE